MIPKLLIFLGFYSTLDPFLCKTAPVHAGAGFDGHGRGLLRKTPGLPVPFPISEPQHSFPSSSSRYQAPIRIFEPLLASTHIFKPPVAFSSPRAHFRAFSRIFNCYHPFPSPYTCYRAPTRVFEPSHALLSPCAHSERYYTF